MSYARVKHIRRHIKVAMALCGEGSSSKEIEQWTMSLSKKIFNAMADIEKEQAETNKMPAWLTPDSVRTLFADPNRDVKSIKPDDAPAVIGPPSQILIAKKASPTPAAPTESSATPQKAPKKLQAIPTKGRKDSAKALDLFLKERRPELKAKAAAMKSDTVKYRSWSINRLVKLVGCRQWKLLTRDSKGAYIAKARQLVPKSINIVGKFSHSILWSPSSASTDSISDTISPPSLAKVEKLSKSRLQTVGKNFLMEAVGVLEGGDANAKAGVRELLGTVATASGVRTLCRGPKFRCPSTSKRLGRKRGSQKFSDTELIAQLQDYSYPCPGVSAKLQVGLRALKMSKRRTAFALKSYKKSQLCFRLRRARLGIVKVSSEKGKCDYCFAWKQGGQKRVIHTLHESRKYLRVVDPNFFDAFDARADDLRVEGLCESENPEYIHEYLEFLASAELQLSDAMSAEEQVEAKTQQFFFQDDLKKHMPEITAINFHRSLITTVEVAWKACYGATGGDTLYYLWDHMAAQAY